MKLRSLQYSEHANDPRYWCLDGLILRDVNLLVGKNASGKSRSLNVIAGLANLLRGRMKALGSGTWVAKFDHEDKEIDYTIEFRDEKVVNEVYTVGGVVRLTRGSDGIGNIFAEKLGDSGTMMPFQTPNSDSAAVSRGGDALQHSFLLPLTGWAQALRFYHFGGEFGKSVLTFLVKDIKVELDTSDESLTASIFKRGNDRFKENFKNAVLRDMNALGYSIKEVSLATPTTITLSGPLPGEPVFLSVQEEDLQCLTDQQGMSSGMYRALAVIIHLNYSLLDGKPSCILIDDIGEGLDYDRSCKLINLLTEKARSSSVQLLMSTNDRFVMNAVPLEDWSLLRRRNQTCEVKNYSNSKKHFDLFDYTGLNNFDFFTTDFLSESLPDETNGDLR